MNIELANFLFDHKIPKFAAHYTSSYIIIAVVVATTENMFVHPFHERKICKRDTRKIRYLNSVEKDVATRFATLILLLFYLIGFQKEKIESRKKSRNSRNSLIFHAALNLCH